LVHYFTAWKWFEALPEESTIESGDLQELFRRVMQDNTLLELSVSFPRDLLFMTTLPDRVVGSLKTLNVYFEGTLNEDTSLALIKSFLVKTSYRQVVIYLKNGVAPQWDVLNTLQENRLDTLDINNFANAWQSLYQSGEASDLGPEFTQTFIASQSVTLTSICLTHANIVIPSPIALPNLETLKIADCVLEGWPNLCVALQSLKTLEMIDVALPNITLSGPYSGPVFPSLENLTHESLEDYLGDCNPWIDAYVTCLPNLSQISTGYISPGTLNSLLIHCPRLEVYNGRPQRTERNTTRLGRFTDSYLAIFTQFFAAQRPALQSLCLAGADFSQEAFESFMSCIPPSITSLELFFCQGLTPLLLRGLVCLPFRKLALNTAFILPEIEREMNAIATAKNGAIQHNDRISI
jgi:hypothetical protein